MSRGWCEKNFLGRRGSEDSSEHLSSSLKILEEDEDFARKHHPRQQITTCAEEFRSFVASFRQDVELLIMRDYHVIRRDDKLQYLQDYKRMSRKMMLG